jgi:hypothetical protein
MRVRHLVPLVALILLGAPASASADCPPTPDVAVVDQYCVLLPSADGRGWDMTERPSNPLREALPARMVERLEKAGLLGQALLAMPQPLTHSPTKAEQRRLTNVERIVSSGRLAEQEAETNVRKGVATIASAASSAFEVAPGLRWALLAATLALLGTAATQVLRRRRAAPTGRALRHG